MSKWKVNLPPSLSTSSRPVLKSVGVVKDMVKDAVKEKNRIDIDIRKNGGVFHATMFSIFYDSTPGGNNYEKILFHLRRLPSIYREMGMFTLSLDIIISDILDEKIKTLTIEDYYNPHLMMDDIFLDEVADFVGTILVVIHRRDSNVQKVEIFKMNR
jgi:hypothetical protein